MLVRVNAMERRRTCFPGNRLQDLQLPAKRKERDPSPDLFVSPAKSPIEPLALPAASESSPKKRAVGRSLPQQAELHRYDVQATHREHRSDIVRLEDPWNQYKPVLTEDQAGQVTVAHGRSSTRSVVAIRRLLGECRPDRIISCQHPNVVALKEAFHSEGAFYFVYEPTSVPLAAIQVMPGPHLRPFEIAAICKEVAMSRRILARLTRSRFCEVFDTYILSSKSRMER